MGLNQTGPVSGLVEFTGEWCGGQKESSKQAGPQRGRWWPWVTGRKIELGAGAGECCWDAEGGRSESRVTPGGLLRSRDSMVETLRRANLPASGGGHVLAQRNDQREAPRMHVWGTAGRLRQSKGMRAKGRPGPGRPRPQTATTPLSPPSSGWQDTEETLH